MMNGDDWDAWHIWWAKAFSGPGEDLPPPPPNAPYLVEEPKGFRVVKNDAENLRTLYRQKSTGDQAWITLKQLRMCPDLEAFRTVFYDEVHGKG